MKPNLPTIENTPPQKYRRRRSGSPKSHSKAVLKNPPDPAEFANSMQVANHCGVNIRTIYELMEEGKFPLSYRYGRYVHWKYSEIDNDPVVCRAIAEKGGTLALPEEPTPEPEESPQLEFDTPTVEPIEAVGEEDVSDELLEELMDMTDELRRETQEAQWNHYVHAMSLEMIRVERFSKLLPSDFAAAVHLRCMAVRDYVPRNRQ